MNPTPRPPLVVMGVSGCGKSTIGSLLGERLGMPFQDGDALHPAANKAKMGAGIALDDSDRKPWLEEIGRTLRASVGQGTPAIIACSALKRSYRDLLRSHVPDVVFVHLNGDRGTLLERMNARNHEFMPPSLLDTQLSTLEPLEQDEKHILADITLARTSLVESICGLLPIGSLTVGASVQE
ncbi:gluconokinase [Paenarthrobacter sp. NPDC057981]|uniref:gluconokinase n=1 Tax=Paenarthrobacter sp. NPDC057981 TaxID=3346297 RepID=UPI0036D9255E